MSKNFNIVFYYFVALSAAVIKFYTIYEHVGNIPVISEFFLFF